MLIGATSHKFLIFLAISASVAEHDLSLNWNRRSRSHFSRCSEARDAIFFIGIFDSCLNQSFVFQAIFYQWRYTGWSFFLESSESSSDVLRSTPTTHRANQKPFILKDLYACFHVFIRVDAVKWPIDPPYFVPNKLVKKVRLSCLYYYYWCLRITKNDQQDWKD